MQPGATQTGGGERGGGGGEKREEEEVEVVMKEDEEKQEEQRGLTVSDDGVSRRGERRQAVYWSEEPSCRHIPAS